MAYHVMARGNQGRAIYANERDRKLWLATLGKACEKTGWRIHAWVMMNNHYHLLLETPEANLVAGMKWLQGTYTQGNGGVGVVVVPAHHGAAALGERAVGDGRRITGDAGHWPAVAERAAGPGTAEEATGAGL
jgi:hypothetical protein